MEIVHSDEDEGKLAFLRDIPDVLLFILLFSFCTFLFSIYYYLAKNQNRTWTICLTMNAVRKYNLYNYAAKSRASSLALIHSFIFLRTHHYNKGVL